MTIVTREEIEILIPRLALKWEGTPFHMNACVKGKGIDCVRFIVAVLKEADLIPMGYEPPAQHADWFYGKSVDKDLFVRHIEQYGEKISFDRRRPGDVISFYVEGTESHLAFLLDNDRIIHAVRDHEVQIHLLRSFMATFCSVYRIKINGTDTD